MSKKDRSDVHRLECRMLLPPTRNSRLSMLSFKCSLLTKLSVTGICQAIKNENLPCIIASGRSWLDKDGMCPAAIPKRAPQHKSNSLHTCTPQTFSNSCHTNSCQAHTQHMKVNGYHGEAQME